MKDLTRENRVLREEIRELELRVSELTALHENLWDPEKYDFLPLLKEEPKV